VCTGFGVAMFASSILLPEDSEPIRARDPSSRLSFDAILREIQARRFAILPGVDCEQVDGAVEGVLKWESQAGHSRSRSR
jgi:hypothetical protein